MIKKIYLLTLTLIILSFHSYSQKDLKIKVKIFSSYQLQSIVFSVIGNGEYKMICRNDTILLNNSTIINLLQQNDSLVIKKWLTNLGSCDTLFLQSLAPASYLRIKPISPDTKVRYYSGDFKIWIDSISHNIMLINIINLEQYLAGVIESELGANASYPLEYLKTQAVISRTYAIKNLGKYKDLGYDLCDNVNCQAYYGKALKNTKIWKVIRETKDLIIVDTSFNIIFSPFYSNSGGETANSYTVWNDTIDYLQSVPDSFSTYGKNYKWKITIKKDVWREYLKAKGLLFDKKFNFSYKMPHRTKYIEFSNGLAIKARDIRKDWGLKSAYFNIIDTGKNIIFDGKGFGHGVGLSQEGAYEMAKRGFSFKEILYYYYTNIKIIPYSEYLKISSLKQINTQ